MSTFMRVLVLVVLIVPVWARAISVAFQSPPQPLVGPSGATASAVARFAECDGDCVLYDFAIVLLGESPEVAAFQYGAEPTEMDFLYGMPSVPSCFAAGSLIVEAATVDEVAFCNRTSGDVEVYSHRAGNTPTYTVSLPGAEVATGALPVSEPIASAWPLVVAGTSTLQVTELNTPPSASWRFSGAGSTVRLQALRLGLYGVYDDVAWSRQGMSSIELLWLTNVVNTAIVPTFFTPVQIPLDAPPNGAGALDADDDGTPDLWVSVGSGPSRLVAIHNDGVAEHLAEATATDMGAELGLVDPRYVRQLQIGGIQALAVADAGSGEVVIITTYEIGGLLTWRASTGGRTVRDIWAPYVDDLTGYGLVVVYDTGGADLFSADKLPIVKWGTPPSTLPMGAPAAYSLEVIDSDDLVANLELFIRPSGASSSQRIDEVAPPHHAVDEFFGATLQASEHELCGDSPVTLIVRATDESGGLGEAIHELVLEDVAPSVEITGSPGPLLVHLAPGGTEQPIEAIGADVCGRDIGFQWVNQGLPSGAVVGPDDTTSARSLHRMFLPESTYADILAAADWTAKVTVTPSSAEGLPGEDVAIDLALDATGLLQIEQVSDKAQLGPGEIALLTITVTSTLNVDLPQVRVADLLEGLEVAGTPMVKGAGVTSANLSGESADLTLDAIPAGGRITITLPVGRTLAEIARARASVFASGGAQLSRSGDSGVLSLKKPRSPGCGHDSDVPAALLVLAFFLARVRKGGRRTGPAPSFSR